MVIRTKIVATIGPASGTVPTLLELARAGVDVFRINFSHGSPDEHERYLANVREVEAKLGRPLAVLGDLCGPKIRVGAIHGGSVLLAEGQEVVIQRDPIEGRADRLSTTLAELADQVHPGEDILLDDGKLKLQVIEARAPKEFVCRVARGGVLAGGKGVNLPHTELAVPSLTEKDHKDAAWIARHDVDFVGLSFVRRAQDVLDLRALLGELGSGAHVVAKIEKPQAMANIDAIIGVADAVMIARGDLGVEMSLPAVPVAQKRIARLCQSAGKPCIIATQMLETMTTSATPTRAEVSDVANAVLDHADAVMLSGETAVGKYPVQAAAMMNEIVGSIEAYHDETPESTRLTCELAHAEVAMAAAVGEIIAVEKIAAVAVFTLTGTTARMFAKHRLTCPILGISPKEATVRRMCLYYGVVSVRGHTVEHTREVLAMASDFVRQRGIAQSGDKIIVISGRPLGKAGQTNTLVVHEVP